MAAKKIIVGAEAPKTDKAPKTEKAPKATKTAAPKAEKAPKADKPAKTEKAPKAPKNEGVEVTTAMPDVMPLTDEQKAAVKADTTKANTRKPKAVVSEAEKHASVQRRKDEAAKKKADKLAEKEAAKAQKKADLAAAKLDPNYAINQRRAKAKFAFLQACVHCGSADVNANRSPYKSEVDGKEVTVRDFHCHECHKYTKADATTGVAFAADATLKNLGYVTTRSNYHRQKGHVTTKAVELAGAVEAVKDAPGAEDFFGFVPTILSHFPGLEAQLAHLGGLLSLALSEGDEGKKAKAVLKDNLVLTF